MATSSSLTGLRQLGKYTISEVLGKGALGPVYKGFDPHARRTVALKTVRRKLVDGERSAALLARFRAEAHAAGRLSHPGNVAVYEWGEAGELAFLAMEYVQGVSLRERFDGGRRFALGGVVSIMVQLLDALQYAHEQGVWQREIEPANIIIMSDGKLKVADFGIDRNGSSVSAQVYMAPEQHNGAPVDARAEIFSAGLVLYQMLTGRHPFDGDAEAIARKICHEAPVLPSQVDPERCAARFDAVVMKALARNPAERHQSAQVFRDELLAAYAGQPSPAAAEETINSEIALPSAPAQVPWPHTDPVPGEPLHPAEPSQSSSPEPSHSTPSQSSGAFPESGHHEAHQPSATSQSSYPTPLPPTGSYPDPVLDAITVSQPGWDAAVLKQVERQLSRIIGPVAKLMVRRAAAITTDVDELYRILASTLTEKDLHAVLLYGWLNKTLEFRPRETDATSAQQADDQARATGPAVQSKPGASAIWPPGWDGAVLTQVERQLARFVGPVARLLVRRGAAGTTDIDELYGVLAGKLTAGYERSAFLAGRNKLHGVPPRESRTTPKLEAADQPSQPSSTPPSQQAPSQTAAPHPDAVQPDPNRVPAGWDPAVLMQVERQLARLVGPVAEWMIRRSATGTTDIDTLYSVLAGQLRHGQERVAFLAGRDRLQGVPPREIDEASASAASQSTDPDHEGFPDVNRDTDGGTPPSRSTT